MLLQKIIELLTGGGAGKEVSKAKTGGGPMGPKSKFVVLMTRLIGDETGEITNRIITNLQGRDAIELRIIDQPPAQQPLGDNIAGLNPILKTCWNWLDSQDADVVVWGELSNNVARIRFVPHDTGGDGNDPALSFADTLVLPANFTEANADLVYTAALASIMPRTQAEQRALVSRLVGALNVFDRFVASPKGLSPEQLIHTRIVGCAISLFIAQAKLDTERAHTVAAQIKQAIASLSKADDPVMWMLAHRHLGDALFFNAAKTNDILALEETAKAYQTVTEGAGMQVLPHEWAEAKARFGKVMHKLAVAKAEMNLLKDAVAGYKSAMTVFTKEAFPHRWAEVKNSIGQALATYGEASGNAAVLAEAAKQFKEVQSVRSKKSSPALWAATQNNMGAVLFSQGKREQSVLVLKEAADCFDTAKEVYAELGAAKIVHVISNNQMRVERLIISLEAGAGKAPKGDGGGDISSPARPAAPSPGMAGQSALAAKKP